MRSKQLNLSDRAISMQATGSPDTIRNMRKRGVIPRIDTIEAVCGLLELEIDITEKPISAAQYALRKIPTTAEILKQSLMHSGRERL